MRSRLVLPGLVTLVSITTLRIAAAQCVSVPVPDGYQLGCTKDGCDSVAVPWGYRRACLPDGCSVAAVPDGYQRACTATSCETVAVPQGYVFACTAGNCNQEAIPSGWQKACTLRDCVTVAVPKWSELACLRIDAKAALEDAVGTERLTIGERGYDRNYARALLLPTPNPGLSATVSVSKPEVANQAAMVVGCNVPCVVFTTSNFAGNKRSGEVEGGATRGFDTLKGRVLSVRVENAAAPQDFKDFKLTIPTAYRTPLVLETGFAASDRSQWSKTGIREGGRDWFTTPDYHDLGQYTCDGVSLTDPTKKSKESYKNKPWQPTLCPPGQNPEQWGPDWKSGLFLSARDLPDGRVDLGILVKLTNPMGNHDKIVNLQFDIMKDDEVLASAAMKPYKLSEKSWGDDPKLTTAVPASTIQTANKLRITMTTQNY